MNHLPMYQFDFHQSTPLNHHDHSHNNSVHHSGKSNQHLGISLRGSLKNVKKSSDNGVSSNREFQHSRMKTHLLSSKNMSRRLFERAKIIHDPKKQTFLIPSQKQMGKNFLCIPSQNSRVFLQVPNLKKIRSHSARRQDLNGSNKKINKSQRSKYHATESSAYNTSGKSNSSAKRTNYEEQLKLSQEENNLIEDNNLFGSRVGQQLLWSLNRKLSRISSIEKKKSHQDLQELYVYKTHAKSSNIIGINIRKIDSQEIETEDSFIRQNQVSSVLKVDESEQKPIKNHDDMSSFSKLIMMDNYQI